MKIMAKFNYDWFYSDDSQLVFHADKYTVESIKPIIEEEIKYTSKETMKQIISKGFVKYGWGTNEDGERQQSYWLTGRNCRGAFPVLVVDFV